jgi:hypothetical protein
MMNVAGSDRAEARECPTLDLVVASLPPGSTQTAHFLNSAFQHAKGSEQESKILDYAASCSRWNPFCKFYLADEKISTEKCTLRVLLKLSSKYQVSTFSGHGYSGGSRDLEPPPA